MLGGISGSNTFTIPSGSALELGATSGTVSVVLTGSGSLSAIGPGVVTLTNTNNYSGGTSVSGGTLVGSVVSLPTAITLSNNANVTFNQNVAGTFSYPIVGTGSLTMAGTNILILTASNGYTGPTTISGGTLEFNSGSNQTLSGGLRGSGALIEQGTGGSTLTLSGTSSYSGRIYLFSGLLSVAAWNNTSSSNLGTGPLYMSGGTLQYTGTGDTTNSVVSAWDPGGTIQVLNPAANLTFTSVQGVNNLSLTKTGSGTMTLAGDGRQRRIVRERGPGHSCPGQDELPGRPCRVEHHQCQPGRRGANGQRRQRRRTNLWRPAQHERDLRFQRHERRVHWTVGHGHNHQRRSSTTSIFTFGYCPGGSIGGSSTFPGVLTNGQGALALAVSGGVNNNALAAGTLILTGTSNAYHGGTTISAGVLQIGDGATSPGSLPGNVTIGTLAYTTTNGSFTANGALIIDTPAGMSLTASGNISGSSSGGLTKTGAGLAASHRQQLLPRRDDRQSGHAGCL